MIPALARLILALGDELSHWATTSERLETVVGDLLNARPLDATALEALQAFDDLSQHLRQLCQLCGDLAIDAPVGVEDTNARVRQALARINLGALAHRLGGTAPHASPTIAGDIELW